MEATYQREIGPAARFVESMGEYHLPDYAGDIKKMLGSSAHIVPTGKFFGGEEVQFAGSVHYDFWYLDTENTLTHESFSSEYEFSCPRAGAQDGAIDVSIAQYSLRPSGPRRMSAKASVEGRITLREDVIYTCEEVGDTHLCKRCGEIEVGRKIFSSPTEREFAEAIPIAPSLAGRELEILSFEGFVQIDGAEAEEGGAVLRGSIVLCAVVAVRGLAPMRLCESYPYEQRIACDACSADMSVAAHGFITSLTADIREAPERAIAFHAICEFGCTAEKNQSVEVVLDAFGEHAQTLPETRSLHYDTFGGARTVLRKADLQIPLAEKEGGGADGVFCTMATLKNTSHAPEKDGGVLSAEAEITVLTYTMESEGTVTYGVRRETVPLSLPLPLAPSTVAQTKHCVHACVQGCEGYVDGDTLCVSIAVQITQKCYMPREVSCMSRVVCSPSVPEKVTPFFALYYPTAGDSLWSVAKRYAISPAVLAASNGVDFDLKEENAVLPSPMLIDCRRN